MARKKAVSPDVAERITKILDSCMLVHKGKRDAIAAVLTPYLSGSGDKAALTANLTKLATDTRDAGQRFRGKLVAKLVAAAGE